MSRRWKTEADILVMRCSWSPMLTTKVPGFGEAWIHSPAAFNTCNAWTSPYCAKSVKHS